MEVEVVRIRRTDATLERKQSERQIELRNKRNPELSLWAFGDLCRLLDDTVIPFYSPPSLSKLETTCFDRNCAMAVDGRRRWPEVVNSSGKELR